MTDEIVILAMADKDSNEVSREIQHMERSAIHRVSSGQGILDLAGAVKELVENSLDAGANRIDIRLKEYGADLIEVADNGPGISPKNYQVCTFGVSCHGVMIPGM